MHKLFSSSNTRKHAQASLLALVMSLVIGMIWSGCQTAPRPESTGATCTPTESVSTATPQSVLATAALSKLRPTNTRVIPRPTPTLTRPQIEAAVRDAIERFQKAKEYSQLTGDTSRLSQDLAGQALERQLELVKQNKAQNCYWEIRLDAPMTYEFLEMRGDAYTRVKAAKTETRHKHCDGQLVASASVDRETYTSHYIVEQIDSKWYVTWRE